MKKVLISDKFYKTVPRDKADRIKRLINRLQIQLNETNQGVFGTTIGNQTLKFQGQNHLYKFRVSDGDRIIYTYTRFLSIESREEYAEGQGIYLIEYVKHDDQNRIARNYDGSIEINQIINSIEEINTEENDVQYADESEYTKYNKYLDLNNTIIYLADESDIERFLSKNDDTLDVLINDQQYDLVQDQSPMVLMGGAGSGKTLVSLHKLNSYKGDKGAYFTYSNRLKSKSEHLFNKISPENNHVSFFTLKDYCLEVLSLSEGRFVDFPWFVKHFDRFRSGIRTPDTLNAVDVWTEIRGILKGFMWEGWIRNYPLRFDEISELSRNVLEQKYNYIKFDINTRSVVCQNLEYSRYKEIANSVRRDPELLPEQKEIILHDIEKISGWVHNFEYKKVNNGLDKRILPFNVYIELGQEISRYNNDEKKAIYKICLKYQELLDSEGLYDDNDLAGYCLSQPETLDKFDYIVVDEVQDLTELQIYLIFHLAADKKNIFLTGDIHQIINPTYFNIRRLKTLFRYNQISFKEEYLKKNYRSQKYIVDLANKLKEIRRRSIAMTKQQSEELEQAILEGEKVFLLDRNNNDLLKETLTAINEKANAATIVCDEEDKNYLEMLLGNQDNNIYTITEIKGLEFDYIFCYNLIGKYIDYWKDIFSNRARRNSKYRYYFNIFYVAITRARRYLCIFDQADLPELENELFSMFDYVNDFDKERLGLTNKDLSPEAWYNRGKELEEYETYDKAIIAYKRGHARENDIKRCEAKQLAKEKKYQEAIYILLNIREYDLAHKYAIDSGIDDLIILTNLICSGKKELHDLEKVYGQEKIISIAAENMDNAVYGNLIQSNYVDKFIINDIQESIYTINEAINRILEVPQ